jgi:hypothetical protein
MLMTPPKIPNRPSVFKPAIDAMKTKNLSCRKPGDFQAYLTRHGIVTQKRTVEHLSVQALKELDKALRDEGIMVFRLGPIAGEKVRLSVWRG